MEKPSESNISHKTFIEGTFHTAKNKCKAKVRLTDKSITIERIENQQTKYAVVKLGDIIGCQIFRTQRQPENCCDCEPGLQLEDGESAEYENSATLFITAYVLKPDENPENRRREKFSTSLTFQSCNAFINNNKKAKKWKCMIYYLRSGSSLPPNIEDILKFEITGTRVLVVVNPKSGSGRARDQFYRRVVSLLQEADIDYQLYMTTHVGDARGLLRSLDLNRFEGRIVCMGGDGTVFEVISGILDRDDWEEALHTAKIGVIPCGSGNALAKSIAYAVDEPYDSDPILISTLNVIRGRTTTMDLARVQTTAGVMYSFLSVSWGIIADIDLGSEPLKFLGQLRFTIWFIFCMIRKKTYIATLSYLRVEDDATNLHLHRKDHLQNTAASCSSNIVDEAETDHLPGDPETGTSRGPPSFLPDLSKPVPGDWTVVHGEFVMVHAAYKSHLTDDMLVAPASRLDDKIIWLCIIKPDISRLQLIQYQLGLSSGSHVSVPHTEIIPVRAFRLDPEAREGCLAVDGERAPTGPVQVEMLTHSVNVMACVD